MPPEVDTTPDLELVGKDWIAADTGLAVICLPLGSNPEYRSAAVSAIHELIRQEGRWGAQTHGLDDWAIILASQVAKLTAAIKRHATSEAEKRSLESIAKEAVQTTALAMQILNRARYLRDNS